MKVCLIGNSHLAAFRLGWDAAAAYYPGLEADFFGARGGDLRSLRVQGDVLTTDDPGVRRQISFTSGGKTAIDVGTYDGFVLVGMGAGASTLMSIGENHRTVAMVGRCDTSHLVSDAVFDLAARRRVELAVFLRLIVRIRRLSKDAPIVVAATPRPGPGIVTDRPSPWLDSDLILPRVEALWSEEKAKIVAEHDVAFVEQPENTVAKGCFTRAKFGKGSIRLAAGFDTVHREDEFEHMNAIYGEAYLDEVLPRLIELIHATAARRERESQELDSSPAESA